MALNSFSLHVYCRKNRYHGLGFLFFFFSYGAGETRNKTAAVGSGFEDHLHQPEERGSSGGREGYTCA